LGHTLIMEDDLPVDAADPDEAGNPGTDREDYMVSVLPFPHMHAAAAFALGAWYSVLFVFAMSLGVRYLHPETPDSHRILQSVAWPLGSGFAAALASRLSSTYRLVVGVGSTLVSVGVWITFLYLVRGNLRHLNELTDESMFGYPLSIGSYLFGLSSLIVIVGLASSYLGAKSRNDEELTGLLFLVPSRHWLWLWIAVIVWLGMLPMVGYYVWLQVATGLFLLIHPSLWFQDAFDVFFSSLGIAALFKGIEISLRAVSDKNSYGGVVWKRVLMFVTGTVVLTSVVSPLLLNLDIDRMKNMPASLGAHPWWIL